MATDTKVELRFTGSGVLLEGKETVVSGATFQVSAKRSKQLLADPYVEVEEIPKSIPKAESKPAPAEKSTASESKKEVK